MTKVINHLHPIFKSDSYLKDVIPFTLIESIKQWATLTMSDEQSYIICGMLSCEVPNWVWTADDITTQQINELCDTYYENFTVENTAFYVAKPNIANILLEKYTKLKPSISSTDIVLMESFVCPNVVPAKNTTTVLCSPNKSNEDLQDIIKLSDEFYKECLNKNLSKEELLKDADKFIANPNSTIIRENGHIVAIAASGRETDTHTSVNHVYTVPDYRGKGFAGAIVAHISSNILKKGKTPVLYTDLSNPCSNKAYQNVGFIPCGKVNEVTVHFK